MLDLFGFETEPQETAMTTFQEFWNVWPRKTAKKAARKAWDKLPETDRIKVMAHLPHRIQTDQQWLKDGGAYIPHPATFLNGERWEDEYQSVSEVRVNYWSLTDRELMNACAEKNISTHGRSKKELIERLEKKCAQQ